MEKIEIRAKSVGDKFKHLFLIYTSADGTEYVVRGGPDGGGFLSGEIDVEFGLYTPASWDWVPLTERKPQDSKVLKTGESLAADYLRMAFRAQMIEQAAVDYDTTQALSFFLGGITGVTNSNTLAASAMDAIGIEATVTVLPESVGEAKKVPGFYNVAKMEKPLMAFLLQKSADDLINASPEMYAELPSLYNRLFTEFQLRFEDELPELRNFMNGSGASDFPELIQRCFLPHTPITLADGTTKPIAAIRPGDMVLSPDRTGTLVPARVTRTFVNDVAHVLDFHGTGVTPGHVFLCGAGRFQGRHVPLIDILRDDGAVVRQDGSLMRASTGCAVGSDGGPTYAGGDRLATRSRRVRLRSWLQMARARRRCATGAVAVQVSGDAVVQSTALPQSRASGRFNPGARRSSAAVRPDGSFHHTVGRAMRPVSGRSDVQVLATE